VQLALQPIPADLVRLGASQSMESLVAPTPAPGPFVELNFTDAAAVDTAKITTAGTSGPQLRAKAGCGLWRFVDNSRLVLAVREISLRVCKHCA